MLPLGVGLISVIKWILGERNLQASKRRKHLAKRFADKKEHIYNGMRALRNIAKMATRLVKKNHE